MTANNCFIQEIQGFSAHRLCNEQVELAVVPELGARVVSLQDRRTQREWLWHPGESLKLFGNKPQDPFEAGPMAGIDECLPTIAPCFWRSRHLPDHGDVWNRAWDVDRDAWRAGVLKTRVQLQCAPLVFERAIELRGNQVRFDYNLSNLGATAEDFIWANHPLLRLRAGDELELPPATRGLLNGEAWINDLAAAVAKNCAKVFARPITDGWAAVKNKASGDRLKFTWNAAENNALGLWMNRGGWNGHHHFALEMTNADDDSLAVAAGRRHCGTVAPHGSTSWRLILSIGPEN